jgi:hypothetical protein
MAVDQPSATTPVAASAQPHGDRQAPDAAPSPTPPGFGSRGRVRRRARFLRKARELAYRDLGGLVFSLHRYGQRNDSLVLAKLATLSRIDAELRALEASLGERQDVTVLREAGITACPRCAAIHSGEDRFCPNCGLSMSRRSDLPIAAPVAAAAPAPVAVGAPAPMPVAAPASPAVPMPAATPQPGAPAAPIPATTASPPTTPAGGMPPGGNDAASGARAPAQPSGPPVTQSFAAVTPADGGDPASRSPAPPATASPSSPAPASDDDQPTEIIRPPAAGS